MKKLLSLSLLTLASTVVFAGGYRVALQGQKQLAMGHTGVAVVNSAEVAFFNPGGMAFLDKRFNISVGGNALFSKTRLQSEQYGWKAASDNFGSPFSAYATYRVTDWLTTGLAVYAPYGSTVKWDQDWQGSFLVNNIALKAIFIQPSVSVRFGEHFSLGGGPIYATGSVGFNRNLQNAGGVLQNADVTLDAKGITAWGYNLGVMFNPTDKIRLGLNYRSEMIMEARDGNATFNDVPDFAKENFPNTTFNANLPLPAEITTGLSVQFTPKLLVAFDYNYTFWDVYKDLNVDFKNPTTPDSNNPRNYKNASTYRFGAQYAATNKFTFRAGYYYDETPVQDGYFAPETPRNDSMGFTGGLTYQATQKLGIDVSFLYVYFDEVNNSYDYSAYGSFGGTYKSMAFSPGIGLTYGF